MVRNSGNFTERDGQRRRQHASRGVGPLRRPAMIAARTLPHHDRGRTFDRRFDSHGINAAALGTLRRASRGTLMHGNPGYTSVGPFLTLLSDNFFGERITEGQTSQMRGVYQN